MTGETISHYEILEELGRGGMGVVYKARDTHLDRFVALKFLPPYLTQDEQAKDRFVREAKAAAAIEHNHICTIHDIAESDDGRTYIVMSYYSGRALNDRIAEGPIPIQDAIRYGAQAASALAAAHWAGIAHRDIKPGNLILTEADEIKLVDFGLAKLAGQVDLTKSRSTVGTAAYMSPEQVKGEQVDYRTDLWSLGIVLYEMVTGERPFQGEYEQALSYAIVNVDPPRLEGQDSLSGELDRLIREALLIKNVDERTQSASEIAEALQAIGSGTTAIPGSRTAATPDHTFTSKAPASRSPIIVGAGALALIAVVIVFLFSDRPGDTGVESQSSSNVTRIAVLPFSIRGSTEYEDLGDGMVDLLSATIDGAGDWHSVDPRWVFSASADVNIDELNPNTARRLANELSASLFVLGNMVEVGGRMRVDAAIYAADGSLDPVGSGEVEGDAENLFPLVDELASQLLLNPEIGSSERLKDLAELTTNSIDALKMYLEGESAFREFDFIRAINSFQRAVETDSTFALAWYRMSVAADWITWTEDAVDAAKKAVQYYDKVSERDKLLFEALLANRTGDMVRAEKLYNDLLLRDPNDSEALFNLGELLFHDAPYIGRSVGEARIIWRQLLEQEPNSAMSLIHLVRIAIYLGEYEEAQRLIEQFLNTVPGGDRNSEILGYKFLLSGDSGDFEAMMVALGTLDVSNLGTTMISFAFTEIPLESFLRILDIFSAESDGTVSMPIWAHAWRSQLLLAHGRLKDARRELSELYSVDANLGMAYEVLTALQPVVQTTALEFTRLLERLQEWDVSSITPQPIPVAVYAANNYLFPLIKPYLIGRVAIELGDMDLAADMVFTLEEDVDESKLLSPLAHAMAAGIRARTLPENSPEQLDELERAQPNSWFQLKSGSAFYSAPYNAFLRGQILQEMGRHEEAVDVFESLRHRPTHDYTYYVTSLIPQARSQIALGQTEVAGELLNRFLDLWEKADPEFEPLKEEARQLLASIN